MLFLARGLRLEKGGESERARGEDMQVDKIVLMVVGVGVLTYDICNFYLVLAYTMYCIVSALQIGASLFLVRNCIASFLVLVSVRGLEFGKVGKLGREDGGG
jgi:hypothetical protein